MIDIKELGPNTSGSGSNTATLPEKPREAAVIVKDYAAASFSGASGSPPMTTP